MTNEVSVMVLSPEISKVAQTIQAYPFVIFIAALVFLGRLIKNSNIPNNYIPWILCLVGSVITPFIADIVPVVKDLNIFMKISTGFCLGFLSSGLYGAIINLPFIRSSEFFSKVLCFEIQPK